MQETQLSRLQDAYDQLQRERQMRRETSIVSAFSEMHDDREEEEEEVTWSLYGGQRKRFQFYQTKDSTAKPLAVKNFKVNRCRIGLLRLAQAEAGNALTDSKKYEFKLTSKATV